MISAGDPVNFTIDDQRVVVNMPNLASLLNAVQVRLATGCGFSLATINLDHLVKLRKSPTFLRAYLAQDFVVADGNPIVWLSRLSGQPVDLVPGSDLVLPLCQIAAKMALPVVFIGSTREALDGAEDALLQRFPNLKIAQKISPPMGFDPQGPDAENLIAGLKSLGPGMCFFALGAPKQEILAARARIIAPQMGFASIGAGLDFLSGHQVRAPIWVRTLALEWLWRALSAPRRLIPRYAACAAILPSEVWAALRQRRT